ncbi:MAG TPA: hypothetical protein VGK74_03845 [Symbiobacteriaceae bacterium]|jgi:nitrate reductase gamma subunit
MASVFLWLALGFFALMVVYRFVKISSMPLHLRWELYPSPLEPNNYGGSFMENVDFINKPRPHLALGGVRELASEVFFLKKVREHNRHGLWPFSLAMHWGTYLLFCWLLLSAAGLASAAHAVDLIACLLGALGCLGLIVKRATNRELAAYTAPVDFFNLLFLLAIFATGLVGWTGLHKTVFGLFLVYMPFTRLFHFVAKYFTFDKIFWDDRLNLRGSDIEKRIQTQLGYKVTWGAAHIAAGKTWVDQVMITDAREGNKQ